MAGYFKYLKLEILPAHAMIPVASASKRETMDIKNVDFSPVRNMGRYSIMILKLKSVSMVLSVWFNNGMRFKRIKRIPFT